MDPETALGLVKTGATLLLLDVPQFTLFGIDTQMFSVGPMFKGIKMVPPGTHFVYYSSTDRDGNDFSPIIGFFVTAKPSEVIVRKWHQQEERLIKLSEDEEERYVVAVKKMEFDHQLGPYALDRYGEWRQISNYITEDIVEQIEPIGGEITIVNEAGLIDTVPKTAMERNLVEQLRNSKFSKPAEKSHKRGCYYTSIPNVIKHKGMSVEELTSLNLDKTQLLETMLMKDFGGAEDKLLGELQFAFIAFLMGQSLEAFHQWKSLISLLLSCIEAPFQTRSQLFTKFVKVIYYQIKYGYHKDQLSKVGTERKDSVFLDDEWLSKDVFLRLLCKEFFSLVQGAPVVDGDLLSWTRKLQNLLETTFGWEFHNDGPDGAYEEDDEFAPVVEMLDDTSFEEGLPT